MQKAKRRHIRAFRDKYLAALLGSALVIAATSSDAQILAAPNGYGEHIRRIVPDSTLYLPTNCGVPTDSTFLHSYGFGGAGQKMRQAAKYYDSCGHHEYVWDPSLRSWHRVDSGSAGGGSGFSIRAVTSSSFSAPADCHLPALNNDSLQIFWNDLGRFLVEGSEWRNIAGGGFSILVPGFDATVNSYSLTLYANNVAAPPGPRSFTSSSFSTTVDCTISDYNGMTLQVFWNDAQRYLVSGTEWTSLAGGGFTVIIPGFNASTSNYSFYVFAQ